jgi:WD40 repeat protein
MTRAGKHALWLGVVFACLASPLSAQEPKPRLTLVGHAGEVRCVAIGPDGKTLASGGADNTIRFWDVASGKEQAAVKNAAVFWVDSVAFSPDGKTLGSGTGGNKVKLWDVGTRKERTLLDKNSEYAAPLVVFSADGKTLASGGRCIREMKLWDVASGQNTATLKGHDADGVKAMAVTRDGKALASVGHDGRIKLWDLTTGKNTAALTIADWVPSAAFSPDGKILATATWVVESINDMNVVTDKRVKLWEVATGKKRAPMKPAAKPDPAAIAKLVRQLGSDDFSTREEASRELGKLDEVPAALQDAANSADPEVARRARGVIGVITARIEEQGTLKGHTAMVSCLVFSPDGKTLATGSEDSTIKLWDVAKGQELAILQGHTGKVLSLAFGADGKLLASGSADKTIKLWDAGKAK